MPINDWRTEPYNVASLRLDAKNPRLGRETTARAPRKFFISVSSMISHGCGLKHSSTWIFPERAAISCQRKQPINCR